ncbi:hypothetical protein [Peribacillus deserti]|uniref:Uncharacterized protein n=1 Tax=Peribacillus deserti TaxID=673318 RepID=A0A2N5M4K1_9BACI|nr:hypothetical protein [Peribacillus deserti]PLT29262.1 hypothetical protein CUU66_13915 [Peribacillus deserti]
MGGQNSGRKSGSRVKKIIYLDGKMYKECRGPFCKGKPVLIEKMQNSYCKECFSEIRKGYKKDFFKYKIREVKNLAKKREMRKRICPVDKSISVLVKKQLEKQKGYCFYSGVKMENEINNIESWSVDRRNYKKGYVKGNIVICTNLTNKVKGIFEHSVYTGLNILENQYPVDKARSTMVSIFKEIINQVRLGNYSNNS